ncbi:MAG: flavin reductase family protein [bacterium]|jgi:flavin reductase (DIM6/NTAB) family NADH-FMN oxidoreductase RutF
MKNMHEVKLADVAPEIINQLAQGAFLTVAEEDKVNTMTVGWTTLGRMWNKPVCVVPVRFSRYTRQLIETAQSFTLSIPLDGTLKEALAFCGSKSGRNVDKFTECGLKQRPGTTVASPAIDGCDIILECRIIHKQTLEPLTLAAEIKQRWYTDNDYHILFYGEVLKAYAKE